MNGVIRRIVRLLMPEQPQPQGRLRAVGYSVLRQNDLEIPEIIVRETPERTNRAIVELCHHCPPVVKALRFIVDAVFGAEDGSDWSLTISPTLADNETPVDPEVKRIGEELLHRIGQHALKVACKRMVGYGDAFGEIVLESKDGGYQIAALHNLPTFQMFRVVSDYGELLGYEQRLSLLDSDVIRFSPVQVVHWRYDPVNLYGRSLFYACRQSWQQLKAAAAALEEGIKTGNNPLVYKLPETWSAEQVEAFRNEKEGLSGVLSQIFIKSPVELTRLGSEPTLRALIDAVQLLLRTIRDQTLLPQWVWTDEQQARLIAGQPALAFLRFISSLRQEMSQGIRQIIDTELVLRGYTDPAQRRYELQWPKLRVNIQQEEEAEQEAEVKEIEREQREWLVTTPTSTPTSTPTLTPTTLRNGCNPR